METSDGSETALFHSTQTAMGGAAAGEDINGTTFSVNWRRRRVDCTLTDASIWGMGLVRR